MKLICKLNHWDSLNDIAPYIHGVLLEDTKQIEQVEALELIPILMLDQMMFPKEVEDYETLISKVAHTSCLFYITDIGLGHLLKKLGLIERTIFDPKTMITNHLDAQIYASYGFHALGISNEITLKDYKAILEKTGLKAFYQVFGYRLMFTSRRRLVSLYSEKIQKSISLANLSIEEATRLGEERYPICENQYGTKIYRNHLICLLKEILNLPMEYAFLDDMGISSNVFKEIVFLFHSAIEQKDVSSLLERLNRLGLPLSDGFSYKDSVYMKEEF